MTYCIFAFEKYRLFDKTVLTWAVMRITVRMTVSLTLTRMIRLRMRMLILALVSIAHDKKMSRTSLSQRPCHLAKNSGSVILISSEDESENQCANYNVNYEAIRQSYVSGLLNGQSSIGRRTCSERQKMPIWSNHPR